MKVFVLKNLKNWDKKLGHLYYWSSYLHQSVKLMNIILFLVLYILLSLAQLKFLEIPRITVLTTFFFLFFFNMRNCREFFFLARLILYFWNFSTADLYLGLWVSFRPSHHFSVLHEVSLLHDCLILLFCFVFFLGTLIRGHCTLLQGCSVLNRDVLRSWLVLCCDFLRDVFS